jgi:hypothetical protein
MCLRGIQSRTLGSVETIALYGVRCTFRVRAFHDIANTTHCLLSKLLTPAREVASGAAVSRRHPELIARHLSALLVAGSVSWASVAPEDARLYGDAQQAPRLPRPVPSGSRSNMPSDLRVGYQQVINARPPRQRLRSSRAERSSGQRRPRQQ